MKFSTAEKYLKQIDPVLADIIATNGHIEPQLTTGYFEALVRSIISQQISVKAATSIRERLIAETNLLPEQIISLSETQVKTIGLSGQKTKYLKDLATHFFDNPKVFDHLDKLSDDEVIEELTRIKGIGVWTAQMFLLFTLHRADVFAPGDRGLQLAMIRHYGLPDTTKPAEFEAFAMKWRPYRSAASVHLWRSLDTTP